MEKIHANQNRRGIPPMTIEHKNIDIVYNLDGRRFSRAIGAYVCGGLALHESLNGGGRTITHVKDGVAIYQNIRHSHNYLTQILQAMAALTDWHQPFDTAITDLYGNKDELNRYRELLEKLAPCPEPSAYRRKR